MMKKTQYGGIEKCTEGERHMERRERAERWRKRGKKREGGESRGGRARKEKREKKGRQWLEDLSWWREHLIH